MIRLTKGETNELLNKISDDNLTYGLIFKLIYIYGKEGMSVLSLKWSSIDFDKDFIRFKGKKFPLSRFVKSDLESLYEYRDTGNEYVFLNGVTDENVNNSVDVLRKKLRYYMSNTVKRLDVNHRIKHVALSITDLRKLRGQHLLCDGVPLKVVMDLYGQENGTSTQFKKYLEYDSIMMELFPCSSIGELFRVYTNLGVFDFDSDGVSNFMVSTLDDSGLEFVVYLSDTDVGFVGEDIPSSVVDTVNGLFDCGLLDCLKVLGDSEYVVFDGLSFVKL